MSEYAETIDEFEHDGWSIKVEVEPDWDYEPGRDDDIYVSMGAVQDLSRGYGEPNDAQTCPECDGYGTIGGIESDEGCPKCEGDGEVPDPDGFTFDTRDGTLYVPGAEVRRLIGIGWGDEVVAGDHPDHEKARESIESDTQAIGHELLTWVGVVVTARLGGLEGSASVWGVEHDQRNNPGGVLWCDLMDVAGELVDEAISEAARAVLGGLAPLALSY